MKHIFIELAKRNNEIKTLSSHKPNWITKVDQSGIYVETEASRQKQERGESSERGAHIQFDYMLIAWEEFTNKRVAIANDFVQTRGRTSFLMAFFAKLPFVEVVQKNGATAIALKEFKTDELPSIKFYRVVDYLNEIIEGIHDPENMRGDIEQARMMASARQDLRLLKVLKDQNKKNVDLIKKYKEDVNRNDIFKEQILKVEFFTITLILLDLLRDLSTKEKKHALLEISMLIVRNSQGDNLMLESVAVKRTNNVINWLQEVHLIDESYVPIFPKGVGYQVFPSNVEQIHEEEEVHLPSRELVNHMYQYITGKGFYYEKDEVTNLYLSLKTKPFVIISGISGTGKTKIVQWFAESVGATERNGQLTIIPVRPDWSDGSDLLGYVDIKGDFKEGPLTKILVNAIENPNRPYFVLLDEMNLARVEHYFSDLLSVMESRKWENGKLMTSPVLDEKTLENEIYLPSNVYIIGTVNMDETTYPFSKKVLDRANTIEFNRVKLDYLRFLTDTEEIDSVTIHNEAFETKYLHLKDVYTQQAKLVEDVTEEIVKINEALQMIAAHVGYRVRDEICFYMAYNEKGNLLSYNDALDRCILQKILPRISGSDTRVDRVLKGLYKVFTNKELTDVKSVTDDDIALAKYPKSTEKVVEMMRRLDEDGFTSFWIGS
ncbi:AAA family ATPase [Alkalihalobacillus sp. MEB203]|uniref:AAA family ATPase n=1 Tax=Alkalihalobacterium chitinilyticum TaxID=2980103 RepID=A0ABT5VFF0_9BACI|nr:AAA family ATPase [Alkalihalobacterium chitinilyticum]MDE5414176.1 AAA family ATPase [Alkalihalobacterium chitinilyticum]